MTARVTFAPASPVGLAGVWLLLAAGYFLTALVNGQFVLSSSQDIGLWSPLWLPTGLAVAAVLRLGARVWPGILIGALVHDYFILELPLALALALDTANVLEALVAAALFRRLSGTTDPLSGSRSVLLFALAVFIAVAGLSATLGVGALALSGVIAWQNAGLMWWIWSLGNTAGALVLTPLLLSGYDAGARSWNRHRLLESALIILLALGVTHTAFGGWLNTPASGLPLGFLALPFLVWAAFRTGRCGTTVLIALLTLIALWNTVQGAGPFVRETGLESVWLLQGYILVVALTGLLLGAVVDERERARRSLQQTLDGLEARIQAGTRELRQANSTLEREIGERTRAERISRGRGRVLEMLATGMPLPDILHTLMEETEAARPDIICSILLLDTDGRHLRHGAAPSLPQHYCEAVDGLEIGPRVGSCGAACYTGERVIVEDIMTHPYWEGLRELAAGAGLRACWSEPVKSAAGEVLGAFGIYQREVASPHPDDLELLSGAAHLAGIAIERKQVEERLYDLANFDKLTGLPNRSAFSSALNHALQHARRHQARVAIFFLDLDDFKLINDTLGHDVGDRLLQDVAQRLRENVRSDDQLARLGGDEFTVLLSDADDFQRVGELAERLLEVLALPYRLAGQDTAVSASIGISLFPDDAEDAATLLKNADIAMYRSKRQGGHSVQFFTPEMNAEAHDRLQLENELRKALERDEFRLYFQPQWDLDGSTVVGLEALLRWEHPTQGLVGPDRFMATAEHSGLIVPIGNRVLQAACEQGMAWLEQGLLPQRIAVNISSRQFQRQDMTEVISRTLRETGFEAGRLELELTETVLMDNGEDTVTMLRALKTMGVHLAIDDFGTGYSSLAYLKRFPIDRLKIDRSFVMDLTRDSDDAAIVAATIALGHNLNRTVIAEGVETQAQLDFLRQHGCDLVQGYLLSRPLPAEAITELLRAQRAEAPDADALA
ncbi:bifunctional diguanylate cyclase/phosphodiesterase [Thiohalobacter thiocyanaticus]|uniref:bifunctional diguanylate cyclase/phosphodiesterase n=1 Tax=Thiohalobacter thiocyanaticus TaxID=585455 RepID=UPI001319FD8A|nr:EAL domain-containing protein [Thiohalobacter thiocyanaticus]